MAKKKPSRTAQRVKDALQDVGGHVSFSEIKRKHDQDLRGFTTRCKTLVNHRNRKASLQFKETHKENESLFYGPMEQKSTSVEMIERGRC